MFRLRRDGTNLVLEWSGRSFVLYPESETRFSTHLRLERGIDKPRVTLTFAIESGLAFVAPCTLAYTVSTIASAIPITVQGFGVTEAIFYRLLVEPGWCTLPQLLATTLSYRAVALLWALPGAAGALTRLEPARS